jgi:hypothetical protein
MSTMFKRGDRWVTMEEIKRTQNKEVTEEVIPEVIEEVTPEVVEEIIPEVIEEVKKPFCEFCDSKGKFHKAGCPLKKEGPGLL